jgi:hypothetical protein
VNARVAQVSEMLLMKEEQLKRRSGTTDWSCYASLYTKDEFRKVSNGPSLEGKFQGMYVKGRNKLNQEIEHCRSIPGNQRQLVQDHIINEDDGEGEPHEVGDEIVICEYYDSRHKY